MAILRRLIFCLLPVFIYAQPNSDSIDIQFDILKSTDLDTATIEDNNKVSLASRLPQDLADIPFTAYVVTQEQIQNRGYSTLVDVLKDLPGIKVSQPGSAMHGETFLMRGLFGNYYVKILVDDLPMQPSATSGMPIGMQLPVAQAERIEVLYGPAAAIYGADAMAGVINIVTKKSDQMQMIEADVAIGLPGNYKFDATLGGKFGKNSRVWNYMFYGGIHQFNNLPITGSKYAEEYNPQNYLVSGDTTDYVNNPFYKGTSTQPAFSFLPQQSLKFGFRMGTKKLNFGADFGSRSTHSAIGSNPLSRLYHDPNTSFGEQILRVFGSYKINVGRWLSQTNLQFLTYEINPQSSYISISNIDLLYQGKFYQYGASADVYFEQLFSTNFGSKWMVLTGVTAQFSGNLPQFDFFRAPFKPASYTFFSTKAPEGYGFLDALGLAPYNYLSLAALADANYTYKSWHVLLGFRVDYREFFGGAINPRIGINYKLNKKNRLRFTSSTAFRPPSSYLINNGLRTVTISGTSRTIPSPNNTLGAERLFNIDAGWTTFLSTKHSLDFSVFFHKNTNLITKTSTYTVVNGELQEYFGYVNDANASARLLGFQLVDRISFSVGSVDFQSDASLQFASGNEVLPFDRGALNHYRMQPTTSLKWLLEAEPVQNLYAGIRTQYFSEWRTRSVVIAALENELVAPSFYTIDVQVRYSFSEGKEVYFMINNLTNAAFHGIGASGGAGVLGNQVLFDDLVYNPQMLRLLKLGVKISIP